MPPPVKLLALDIDGTLLPSTGTHITPRTCRALREAQTRGIEIVIATGRRQAYAVPLIHPVGLRSETVLITSNGTITRTLAGQPLDRWLLPIETARALCPILRRLGGATVFTFDRDGPGELVLESLDQLHARIAMWVEANRPWIEEVRPLERAFDSGEAPVQAMVCGTLQAMREAEVFLAGSDFASRIEVHRTEYPSRDLTIVDILPPGCSKGVALRKLAQARGFARDEIMAIGDNWNDLEMLEYAGQPVVMSNGPADLLHTARRRGWQFAPLNDDDGVAHILDQLRESVGKPAE